MEVGNRIRRERQRLGISQEELSRRAYVSRPTLSHWETGRTLPDAQSLLVLSEIFGTSIDELVKGDVAEMEEMVDREARVAIGRTLALACVAVGAGVCLVAVSFGDGLYGDCTGGREGRIRCIRRRGACRVGCGQVRRCG